MKATAPRPPLNRRQQRFVDEYLKDLNATAAYRRAGYEARGNVAEVSAARLLRHVQVEAAVRKAMDARAKRTQLSADRVLEELARIAGFNLVDVVSWDARGLRLKPSADLPREVSACLLEVSERTTTSPEGFEVMTRKVKAHDKLRALELLCRHLGLLERKSAESDGGADDGTALPMPFDFGARQS